MLTYEILKELWMKWLYSGKNETFGAFLDDRVSEDFSSIRYIQSPEKAYKEAREYLDWRFK